MKKGKLASIALLGLSLSLVGCTGQDKNMQKKAPAQKAQPKNGNGMMNGDGTHGETMHGDMPGSPMNGQGMTGGNGNMNGKGMTGSNGGMSDKGMTGGNGGMNGQTKNGTGTNGAKPKM